MKLIDLIGQRFGRLTVIERAIKTQNRNTRQNVFVNYNGVDMTLAEAAELSGINPATLWHRLQRGEKGDWLFRLPK